MAVCYGNQLGCILRDTSNINDTKIRKNEHLKKLLLTRLHARFLFPGRNDDVDPWDDDAMKKNQQQSPREVRQHIERLEN